MVKQGRPFFDHIPWSRIVEGGWKAFENVELYIIRNELEASGEMSYLPRKKRMILQA